MGISAYNDPPAATLIICIPLQIPIVGTEFLKAKSNINFSNVSDRQKAFVPKIGLNKKSSKIRVENSLLKLPDGRPANLSPTERVELSTFDTAPLDSNKLGVFFAPTDVINEDIMLSLADMDFGAYLGDPRDTVSYTHLTLPTNDLL